MKISFRYKVAGDDGWRSRPITPEEYFEPLFEEERPFEWDDVPDRLSPDEYLDVATERDLATEVRIWDPDDKLQLVVREVFWARRRHHVTHRVEEGLELLIVQVLVKGEPNVWHTVRLNHHPDGQGFLEHLQAIEDGRRQFEGPCIKTDAPPSRRVSWHEGRSECLLDSDEQSFGCTLRVLTSESPDEWEVVDARFRSEGGARVEHRTGGRRDAAAPCGITVVEM